MSVIFSPFNTFNNYYWALSMSIICFCIFLQWFNRPSIGIRIKPSSVFFIAFKLLFCYYSNWQLTKNGTTVVFGSWMTFRRALEITKTESHTNKYVKKESGRESEMKKVVLHKWPLKKVCSTTIQNLRLHMVKKIFNVKSEKMVVTGNSFTKLLSFCLKFYLNLTNSKMSNKSDFIAVDLQWFGQFHSHTICTQYTGFFFAYTQ